MASEIKHKFEGIWKNYKDEKFDAFLDANGELL